MTHCELMTDRMPDVVAGRGEWTMEERAHLEDCRECAAEWRLLQTADRLHLATSARLDPERIAGAVAVRLGRVRRRRLWTRAGLLSGLAAAAALAIFIRTDHRATVGRPVAASGFVLPQAELDRLDATQLEAVLDLLDGPVGRDAGDPAPMLDNLNDQQLEHVLRSLEG